MKNLQPGDHGNRAGIVSIINHRNPVLFVDLLAVLESGKLLQSPDSRVQRHTIFIRHSQRHHSVQHIMASHHLQRHCHLSVFAHSSKYRISIDNPDIFCPVAAVFSGSVIYRPAALLCPGFPQQRIIPVQEQNAALLQTILNCQLLPVNVFLTSQLLNMRNSHIGNHRHIYLCNPGNDCQFSRHTHSQFYHADFICRSNL